jgi:hypothetical protein
MIAYLNNTLSTFSIFTEPRLFNARPSTEYFEELSFFALLVFALEPGVTLIELMNSGDDEFFAVVVLPVAVACFDVLHETIPKDAIMITNQFFNGYILKIFNRLVCAKIRVKAVKTAISGHFRHAGHLTDHTAPNLFKLKNPVRMRL